MRYFGTGILTLLMIPVILFGRDWSNFKIPVLVQIEYSVYEQDEEKCHDEKEKRAGKEPKLSVEDALDLLKNRIASDFIKVFYEEENTSLYFYQMPESSLYLVYEDAMSEEYIFRLYEFIPDDEINQIGHCYTYGIYYVNKQNGAIQIYGNTTTTISQD